MQHVILISSLKKMVVKVKILANSCCGSDKLSNKRVLQLVLINNLTVLIKMIYMTSTSDYYFQWFTQGLFIDLPFVF